MCHFLERQDNSRYWSALGYVLDLASVSNAVGVTIVMGAGDWTGENGANYGCSCCTLHFAILHIHEMLYEYVPMVLIFANVVMQPSDDFHAV